MTPLQLAHTHRANWNADGSCLGAIIDDDLQIRRCRPRPRCIVGTPGQRCSYFEECILPMERSLHDSGQRQQFNDAARQYRLAANVSSQEKRACPDCGRPMEPRQRFCPICADSRRRETNRQAKSRSRVRCQQLTPKRLLMESDLRGGKTVSATPTADPAKNAVNC
jgi:hypothetical protein